MKHKQIDYMIVLMLLAATLCSSCVSQALMEGGGTDPQNNYASFTERLWEATSAGNDVIEIPFSEIPEAALVQDGIAYTKNEERKFYYIEGSSEEKTKDRVLRIIGTPVAVAADLCLEGICVFAVAMSGMPYDLYETQSGCIDSRYADWARSSAFSQGTFPKNRACTN